MHIFNGYELARIREQDLQEKIESSFSDKKLVISAILFSEDAGSRLYTQLKSEAAQRVGIEYRIIEHSVSDPVSEILQSIVNLNEDISVTGIIIQKPYRKTWKKGLDDTVLDQVANSDNPKATERHLFVSWWEQLTSTISEKKDVDGLHPHTIKQIENGTWKENKKVLPATCRAVLTILDFSRKVVPQAILNGKYVLIGKSDLLGIPLYNVLKHQGIDVEIIATKELDERKATGRFLLDADVIVSATGVRNLITADMIKENVVVIDVGEPRQDVSFQDVSKKAGFITPVPGGVGPMTVISLLENCVVLHQ